MREGREFWLKDFHLLHGIMRYFLTMNMISHWSIVSSHLLQYALMTNDGMTID